MEEVVTSTSGLLKNSAPAHEHLGACGAGLTFKPPQLSFGYYSAHHKNGKQISMELTFPLAFSTILAAPGRKVPTLRAKETTWGTSEVRGEGNRETVGTVKLSQS